VEMLKRIKNNQVIYVLVAIRGYNAQGLKIDIEPMDGICVSFPVKNGHTIS
jgi:hypothetical protein